MMKAMAVTTPDAELPFIDAHEIVLATDVARAWARLLAVVSRAFLLSGRGFPGREEMPPRALVLSGEHPFAVYVLRFDLEEVPGDGGAPTRTLVRATTFARFKGRSGAVYRALVIGTGAHAVIVRRFLASTAASRGGARHES